MTPSTNYQSNLSFALLLVGEPKSGKTRVAGSFPRPYFLDFDRNLASLIGEFPDARFFYDNPYADDSGKEIAESDLWEENINKRLKAALVHPEIDTVVIDSLSTLNDVLIAHIIREVRKMEGKKIVNLRIQDYMTFRNLYVRLITYLRRSTKNIVFTSHQKIDKDELTGVISYRLNIPGQLADNYGGFFSDVWAAEGKPGGRGPSYHLHTGPIFRHVDLGHSFKLEQTYDVTGKSPSDIWSLISPTFVGRTSTDNQNQKPTKTNTK